MFGFQRFFDINASVFSSCGCFSRQCGREYHVGCLKKAGMVDINVCYALQLFQCLQILVVRWLMVSNMSDKLMW